MVAISLTCLMLVREQCTLQINQSRRAPLSQIFLSRLANILGWPSIYLGSLPKYSLCGKQWYKFHFWLKGGKKGFAPPFFKDKRFQYCKSAKVLPHYLWNKLCSIRVYHSCKESKILHDRSYCRWKQNKNLMYAFEFCMKIEGVT